jgi:hypothetical protein
MSTRTVKLFVLAALVVGTLAVGNSRYQQAQAEQPPCPSTLPSASSATPPPGGTIQIVGPAQGTPGQALTFKLMDGTTQLSVDRWEQVLNPDLYLGNDYVTSFCLNMQPQQDGSLQITAPAPGRYKLAAIRGSERWETYVLIGPPSVVPEVRGAYFAGNGPVDREQASHVFALARRAGMTWAAITETAGLDLDAANLPIEPFCSFCSGTVRLEDLEWLIDEAHGQGLKVAVEPSLWARTRQRDQPVAPYFFAMQTKDGLIGDLPALLPGDSPLIPAVMQSYARYMLQMAQIAQRHGAEAMFVGHETNTDNIPNSLLWSQKEQWKAMFVDLRSTFQGRLWVGSAYGGCQDPNDQEIWTLGDGISAPTLSGIQGSGSQCGPQAPASNNPTAEQMIAHMNQSIGNMFAAKLHAGTGLPIIWSELYTVPLDGVNRLGSAVFGMIDQGTRDNQEIVDVFEAQMRALQKQKLLDGYFLFQVSLDASSGYNNQDTLKQPALVSAIANWWGGDIAYFAPCWSPAPPPGLLLQENFEPSSCPLEQQDTLVSTGWTVIPDPANPGNHVLRGTGDPGTAWGALIPAIGRLSWTDYTIKLRMRLMPGPQPSSYIIFRDGVGDGWYQVNFGFNQLGLVKRAKGQYLQLASLLLPGGTQVGQWYQLEIDAVGATITVKLNGQQIIRLTDQSAPLLNGGIHLGVGGGAGPATVDFDDMQIDAVGR